MEQHLPSLTPILQITITVSLAIFNTKVYCYLIKIMSLILACQALQDWQLTPQISLPHLCTGRATPAK